MKKLLLPANETERVAALNRYKRLSSTPDTVFDNITQATASLCETPIALINFIGPSRQWTKSCFGMNAADTSREFSFCSHAILNPTDFMEIRDVSQDDRFAQYPLVTDTPNVRFYAGQPLVTPDGFALGTLCVLDSKPRSLSAPQRDALKSLAKTIINLLEERRQIAMTPIGHAIEDTIHSGILITDATQPDNPITHCNRGFEVLTGYTKDEILGKNCRFLQGKDTDPTQVRKLREAVAEKRDHGVTIKNYRKDGSPFWNELLISPVRNSAGLVTHFLGIQNDVSSRKRAEERAAGLGDVVEASINEIFIFDQTSLRFLHINQGARDNLGYSDAELRQLTPVDIKPEFTLETFEAVLNPLRTKSRNKVDFVTLHRRKDGSTYPVEVHIRRSHFDSRPVFAAIILDITDRTRTEEALAQARLFLESAPDATLIINDSGKIEVANSQAARLFAYPTDELCGMSVDVLVPGRFGDGHARHRKQYMADPKVRGMGADLDLYAVTKAGAEIPIEVSLSPIRTGDGTLIAAAIRDVTARKQAAEALTLSKEIAESATVAKTRFLAAASHDLRQPLQSIGLYLSVLDRKLDKPENINVSEKIRDSLDVMSELLDALLDISKLDSGSIKPTKKDFCIQSLFDHLQSSCGPQAGEKRLDFRCEASTSVVHSDPALLLRVVENFVNNAIRYTEAGRVIVRCENHGDYARIAVLDDGVGIPEDAIDSIFEEYFQLDNPVRDRRKGLGLGLSIVKHIARLLDHRLQVTSTPGEGSIFSVEVPLGQSVEQPDKPPSRVATSREAKQEPVVLLIDDDPGIVDATTMLLSGSGFKVYSALSGDEAMIHIANGIRPDIVVSDYRLPGYNGVEVVRRVRQRTANELPTILMTGDTSSQEIESADLPHCTVLHKPVNTDRLISLIHTLTA